MHLDDGRSVFVKQARPGCSTDDVVAIHQEATVLAAATAAGAPAPRLLARDATNALLVVEDLGHRATLERLRDTASDATHRAWARHAAVALASLHDAPTSDLVAVDPAGRAVRQCTVLTPMAVATYPAGLTEMARRVTAAGLKPLLREVVAVPRDRTFVHGDVKCDNVLCDERDARPVMLVDWELGGLGDPRWDVGCLVGDHLFAWLSRLDFTAGPTLDDWLSGAPRRWDVVAGDLAAIFEEYAARRRVADLDRVQWVRLAALYLLQRTLVAATQAPRLPSAALAYLQVAGQLLRHPEILLEAS